jgi:REP element-mobilizing transposase RayT
MTYWLTYYHLNWATQNRLPLIDEERAAILQRSFRATGHEEGALVHAIGIMPDHVHLAVSIPPRLAVSTFVRQLKGSSSHLLNHAARDDRDDDFGWQREFGVVTFGERSFPDVVAYVENQRQRHADNLAWPIFERTERDRSLGEAS